MSDVEDDFEDDPEIGEEETLPVAADVEMDAEEEDDEKKEEEEEEEEIPENPLTEEMVAESLSLLSRTGDGLAHAYIRLDLHEKEVTDVSILKKFIHLRFVDLSRNMLKDISHLNSLTHLLTLKAENNLLPSAKLETMPYLQSASFMRNKIKTTEGLSHPMLESLCLSFNEITVVSGLDPAMLGRLTSLELRGNKLETTAGLNIPTLKTLFLGGNVITKLEGLEGLTQLTTLHLRDNQLENLDGFSASMATLSYINLRANNVSVIAELKKLNVLPSLKAVSLSENPISDDDEYRLEALMVLPELARLDKDEVVEEERAEAVEMARSRAEQLKEETMMAEGDEAQAPED